jgi:hypothetical protein
MKNVIAYSLWGDHPIYWKGALENIKQVSKYFPGWICKFYIDKNCKSELINSIIGDNVEVELVESVDSFHGMFWRFWASEDPEVDIFLSRDCDSRFSNREISAINEWLSSDKDFHIMRDHPYHTVPILGGMWGCRNGLMRRIKLSDLIKSWNKFERKGIDQDFLGQVVYPIVINKSFEHSEFNLKFGGNIKKFPTERKDYEFVGDVFDESNVRHPDYWKIIYQYEKINLNRV